MDEDEHLERTFSCGIILLVLCGFVGHVDGFVLSWSMGPT